MPTVSSPLASPLRMGAALALAVATLSLTACDDPPPVSSRESMQPQPAVSDAKVTPPAGDQAVNDTEIDQTNDPLESTNRFFYKFNDTLDRYTFKPLAQGYVAVVPTPVRTGLHNVLANLSSPVLFGNDVLQAKPGRAGDTLGRFLINSTFGIGGIFDAAKDFGIPAHDTGFNVTLGVWGVPDGPFLYLPILGPSSPRGVAGFAGDIVLDPFTYVPRGYGLLTLNWARYGLGLIDTRSRLLTDLDKVQAGALDPYATIRSLYRQHEQSQIDEARQAH